MPSAAELEPPSSRTTRYADAVRQFSRRLIQLQRPVRLLEALRWDEQVAHTFLARGGRELPRIVQADYQNIPLGFDPDRRQMEFQDLERDITRVLGARVGAGRILTRMCREYASVVRMLAWRGSRCFAELSARLFGSARSSATDEALKLLEEMGRRYPGTASPDANRDATAAMDELSKRLAGYFAPHEVRFKLVDCISADAAAGTDYLKLRRDAHFTPEEIRLLEVHEGWVHLGTSFNARYQPTCGFLRKGPPTSTRTQEGLAVLTEFLSGAGHPARLQRLRQRVLGIRLAEQGADFVQVFRFLRESATDDRDCYQQTARIFRGSLPTGCGPFTKDLCYVQGLASVVTAIRHANAQGHAGRIPLLFCGKTAVEDLDTLAELAAEGHIHPPRFVPPPFQRALSL